MADESKAEPGVVVTGISTSPRVVVCDTMDEARVPLGKYVAKCEETRLAQQSAEGVERPVFNVAISGGSLPKVCCRMNVSRCWEGVWGWLARGWLALWIGFGLHVC